MHSDTDDPYGPGFPIRRSQDQSSVTSSPGLIAGSNVLHRLSTPRHPPCALSSLTVPTSTRSGTEGVGAGIHSPEMTPSNIWTTCESRDRNNHPEDRKEKRVVRKHLATQDLSASAFSGHLRGTKPRGCPLGTGLNAATSCTSFQRARTACLDKQAVQLDSRDHFRASEARSDRIAIPAKVSRPPKGQFLDFRAGF